MPPVSEPLPWQAGQWQQLLQQFECGQLPHALMLAGPRYTGKGEFALALARLLLCQAPSRGRNCGGCHACELSRAGNHGDFRRLSPEGKSRVIKIDQVREAVEFCARTAGFGERKVVIIDPADSLNVNAANALLKCLEEPAPGTHMLLVCHRLHGVPATIRSRCQPLRFPLPTAGDCLPWLAGTESDETAAAALLGLAGGAPLLARQLHADGAAARITALRQGLDALRSGQLTAPQAAALLADTSLEDSLALLRDYLQHWLCGRAREELATQTARNAFALLDEVRRVQGAMQAGSNPNQQLLLDTLLSRLQRDLGSRPRVGIRG